MDAFKDFSKALGAVLLLAATLILAVHLGMKLEADMGDAGKSLSGWVQAVGSIAAILGAVYVTRMQMVHVAKSRRAAIVAIGEAAMTRVDEVEKLVSEKNPRAALFARFPTWRLDRVISAFDAAPVHDIQSGDGVIAFLAIREHLVLLQKAVKECTDGPDSHPKFSDGLRALRDRYENDEYQKQFAYLAETLKTNVMTQVGVIREHFSTLRGCL